MKFKLKFGFLVLTFLPSLGLAEEYYAPVPKELEPLARLPLPSYEMTDANLKYTLPRDLTGREIKIELTRDAAAGDFPKVYRGEKAAVSCMGTNELPACVVTHQDLGISRDEAIEFLKLKYRDPKRLEGAIKVLDTFASGSQPLGVISKRTIPLVKELPKLWSVEILMNAKDGAAQSSLARVELNLQTKIWQSGSQIWPISDLFMDASHLRGDYQRAGMRHWFDLTFSTDKSSFEGTWGFFDSNGIPQSAMGTLKGLELKSR